MQHFLMQLGGSKNIENKFKSLDQRNRTITQRWFSAENYAEEFGPPQSSPCQNSPNTQVKEQLDPRFFL